MTYIAAIDQGTTSARTIIYNEAGIIQADHRTAIHSLFPQNGWVEQHPEDLWAAALTTWRSALDEAGLMASDIAMLGMTNQRETTLLWDAVTGQPVYNAIVWQDRRTKQHCDELKRQGVESLVQQKTGLLLDPYFSATKIAWILQNIPQAKRLAKQGQLRFGTVDTFILWHLTEGKVFATDATNASRTLLFNIFSQSWDQELLDLFEIPESILPTVKNTVDDFGETTCGEWQAVIPIRVVIGDQQAALIGQGCVNRGMAKSTYGTGCFMMMNTGEKAIASDHRLLSTVAYRFAGKTHYALEGSIFCAGVTMQWLQDNVHMIKNIAESSRLAQAVKDNGGVYFVPAFTGLAAPHWLPDAQSHYYGNNTRHPFRAYCQICIRGCLLSNPRSYFSDGARCRFRNDNIAC